MASTGTKLFKIASQINVGKETIVAFLQAKGFAIENKATSTLTGDMVDLVLGNFQKEAAAALKQREKDAPQHEEVHNEVHQNVVSMQSSEPHQSESAHNAEQQATQVVHQNEVPSVPSPENTDVRKDVPHDTKADNGAAVGSVIQLDDSSSRRKSKKTKAEEISQPSVDAIQKTEKSASKDSPEELKPVLDVKLESTTAAQEPIQEHFLVATAIDGVQSPDSPVVTQPDETAPSILQGADVEALGADEEIDDTHEDHTEEGKRKRKKRIGEVEYFVDNAPYATPMPTGLTILGKIELGGRRGDGSSKDGNKAPERGGERGGGRGGSGKPAPRTGAQSGDARPKPGAAAAKPKDWTKPGAPAPVKKFGTVGGTSSTTAAGSAANKKKRKKGKREQVSAVEVDKAIRRTLSGQEESQLAMRSRLRRSRKQERADEQAHQAELRELDDAILRVTEFITVAELADNIGVATNEIILKCMSLGLMVSINQRLEKDTITLIAADYGLEVEFEDAFAEEALEEDDEDDEEFLEARAPIVTVMGHVDHGKTSLLDHIRKTSVVSGESGGITQHIGAYSVKMNDGKFITFLDTPGHQAFTAMRARGAQLTDLVVLVVAADDNVMPQTIEAISHARAANVPMIVAINKMDKADANPDKVRQQLSDHNVLVEEWGGKFQSAMISAKKGTNIDQLLEKILLEAEILNLRANPDRYARGTVVESKIDKGKGTVATVVVQKGTLRVGDPFLCGIHSGRVRAMFNENGERIEEAIPSTPVQILGFDGVPQAGDSFVAMESEVEAREIATTRQQIKREQDFKRVRHVTLDDIASRIKAGGVQELKIILKGDTDGSVEALTDSLQKLSTEEVKVSIIHRAVGSILEADVMLAAASEAIIVGFHVRPNPQVAKLAENEGVDIRLYRIIYDCINEVKLALEGMLLPEIKEEVVGVAEVREVFKISKLGNIAGCYMLEGKINRNDTIRVLRDGFEVFTGRLASLKRMKEDVKEIDAGFECGMSVDGFNDIQNGDLIEAVRKTEIKRKL
jgi:translation initiation factor IF-2